ncbi:MAG: inorganic phosphate transporter [Lawsonibacter sp.]|jgi:PiT family inorganic phosphate transporter
MPHSFFSFFQQMLHTPALAAVSILIFAVLLANGCTDAPNAIAGIVSSGTLSFRQAVLLASICNFAGVFCVTAVTASVAETVYSIASFGGGSSTALIALCTALSSIVVWAWSAWLFGIPTSESHALVAGISGAAVALEGTFSCIRWDCWGKVLFGLFFSVVAGFYFSRFSLNWLNKIHLSPKFYTLAQIPGAACTAFLHGAQDGQKFIGIFLLGTALAQGRGDEQTFLIPLWLMFLCALFMALGTLMGGKRIIDTIASEMVNLDTKEALAADWGSIPCLILSTVLGLPVSTTHIRTTALLGASHRRAPSWRIAGRIAFTWLLTFPICFAMSYSMTRLVLTFAQSFLLP